MPAKPSPRRCAGSLWGAGVSRRSSASNFSAVLQKWSTVVFYYSSRAKSTAFFWWDSTRAGVRKRKRTGRQTPEHTAGIHDRQYDRRTVRFIESRKGRRGRGPPWLSAIAVPSIGELRSFPHEAREFFAPGRPAQIALGGAMCLHPQAGDAHAERECRG